MSNKEGMLIVFSGPSGSGKGTVLKKVFENAVKIGEQFAFSVSATTRDPRPGEVDGEHYFFMTKNKFSSLAKSGGMIEWAQFCGNFYGTPREAVEKNLKEGKNVVLEIEVQGAAQVMAQYPDCVSIFILPPSIEELEARLRGRKTESDDVIKKRISASHDEIKFSLKYRHLVINDEVDRAADEVLDIIRREREIKENKNTLVGRVLNNG